MGFRTLCGLGTCFLTGCSSGPATAGARCGSENEYAARLRDGQVPGNCGGVPVVVNGWTCQGYDTPEVLRTGNASQCHSGGNAILAVLAVPDATKTPA
jgi:hypothetical protein